MKAQTTMSAILSATIIAAISGYTAFAHVTVKPGDVPTATYQVFTVNVPNEKEIPTVSVKLVIPESVTSVTPTNKPGWKIATETDGEGDAEKITAITWSDGKIADGLRDEFSFSAKTPDQDTELQWKAYQTYSDGTVVSWDKAEEEGGHAHGDDSNSGPYSVTNVTTDDTGSETSSNNAQISADRALYVASAAVILGLVSVFLATRKK